MSFGNIKENLDLFLFSVINVIFFIFYYKFFQESHDYSANHCSELPRVSKYMEFGHLAVFAIFCLSFLVKSFLITWRNKEESVSKYTSCLLNMSVFLSSIALIGILLNLFYVYYTLGEECEELNKVVLSDIVVLSVCLLVFIIYRLCLKAIIKSNIKDDDILEGKTYEKAITNKRNNHDYGTIISEEN